MSAALVLALLGPSLSFAPVRAAESGPIKIAVITDMSGVYAALAGQGAVEATKMAVEDFGGKVLGRPVEVVAIDHRNNGPDAAIKAREQYDSGADLALDMTNSAVALAVAGVAKEKHKLAIVTGGASSALTGASCNRYTYHYAYDTYALAFSTGSNIAAQSNGKTWYAIVPNYAFGQQMLEDFRNSVQQKGGRITKADLYPFPATQDFSSYLLAAKNSGDQVLGLFNAGADTVTSMKQAKQFAVDKAMKIAVGLLFLSDVDALPDVFAGSRITTSWYWNEDSAARKWADRYAKRMRGLRPTDIQASDYSAAWQWLSAVKAVGTTDADKVQQYLDGRQFNDFYAHGGEWRARDHRVLHEMYVVDVLPRNQVKEPHAWFKIVQTIPPGRAFRPESQSTCKKDW
ncbi:MAG: ABC transporter substrate-binding protein [Candidatus Eremiobacteraeota bacterium]|nr:ABC transporter substrate-binding protein [Candidatus Eremiobacteraeota bacterium]